MRAPREFIARPARLRGIAAAVLLLCGILGAASEQAPPDPPTFYVSPAGNDAWSGRLDAPDSARADGPFATLDAARDAARALGTDNPRRIVVSGGDYHLSSPLTLTPADSGLRIEAAPGERPALYGGTRIEGWRPDGDRFWSAPVPEAADGSWDFRMLSVNGRFCRRARLPESGEFEHLNEFGVSWMGSTGGGWQRPPTDEELTTLRYRPEDIGPWFDPRNAELTIYHMWDESVVGVAAHDPEAHTITFSTPAGHPPGAFGVRRYAVWNLHEGMTQPGQWRLDRAAGKVVYWPLPGEDMGEAVVVAPRGDAVLRIEGREKDYVWDLRIAGLTLSVADCPLMTGGFGAHRLGGAVNAARAADCVLAELDIFCVAGHGIRTWDTPGIRVERCRVHHTGAGGIIARGRDGTVADNHVHDVGLAYPSGIGIWCSGERMRVEHNEIHDTSYSGIVCGGRDNRIEYNRIYRVMRELRDGAAIYVSPQSAEVVLRGNYAHDINATPGYPVSAYYLDELAEGCLVEKNLAVNVAWPAHNHIGVGNTLRNNVFVHDGDMKLTFQSSTGYTVERNVIVAGGEIVLANPDALDTVSANVLFSRADRVVFHELDKYRKVGERPFDPVGDNVFADPLLEDYAAGLVRFAPDSPAAALGIEPIDVRAAGRR